MNYYPFHVGDYMAHTAHLDPLEDIAYRRLLDLYYLREQPIPLDPNEAARLVRMKVNAAEVTAVLAEFFEQTEEGWRHVRCDEEIERMQEKRQASEEKTGSEKERMRRHRVRRKELFDLLRDRGVVPSWDIGMTDLQELYNQTCNAPETHLQRVQETASNAPATAIPTPTPTPISKSKIKSSCAERSDDHSPQVESIPLASGDEYPITQQQADEFSRAYPAVNVLAELRKMRAWSMSNPKNRKTKGGVLRFVNQWLGRAQDNAPSARAGPQPVSKTGSAFLALDRIANGNDFHEREHLDGLALAGDRPRIPALAGPRS